MQTKNLTAFNQDLQIFYHRIKILLEIFIFNDKLAADS